MSLLNKMLRIAGRGDDGTAKAIKTDDNGVLKTNSTGGYILDYINATGNTSKTYTNLVKELSIMNDGEENINVHVNEMNITIKSGEVFNGKFVPFNDFSITTTSTYRVWVVGL